MHIDADFHIHSPYSMAVSPEMTIENIAANARLKGLHMVGTGDCLHPDWLSQIKEKLVEVAPGTYEHPGSGTKFVLTTEVEDRDRVHHLIFLPSIGAAEDVRKEMGPFTSGIDKDGRPRTRLSGEAIGTIIVQAGGMIGPAHAFTPWTSMYKSFRHLKDCYKSVPVHFLELGLSADTYSADKVSELSGVTFLTNSDSHSPYPHRLGREFNRLLVESATYGEVARALARDGGRKVILNVGFDPREGKYHCTACSNCYHKYSLDESKGFQFKCVKCNGGRIKMGVRDRIDTELADQKSTSPKHRPNYVQIFPLAEIIQKAKGYASPTVKGVQDIWRKIVETYGSEIAVLLDVSVDDIRHIDADAASAIEKFRNGEVILVPGGGGKYGELIIPKDAAELKRIVKERANEINCVSGLDQKTLNKFF